MGALWDTLCEWTTYADCVECMLLADLPEGTLSSGRLHFILFATREGASFSPKAIGTTEGIQRPLTSTCPKH